MKIPQILYCLSKQRHAETETGIHKTTPFTGTSFSSTITKKNRILSLFKLSFLLVLPKSVSFLKTQMWLMKEALVEITTTVTVFRNAYFQL